MDSKGLFLTGIRGQLRAGGLGHKSGFGVNGLAKAIGAGGRTSRRLDAGEADADGQIKAPCQETSARAGFGRRGVSPPGEVCTITVFFTNSYGAGEPALQARNDSDGCPSTTIPPVAYIPQKFVKSKSNSQMVPPHPVNYGKPGHLTRSD